MSWKRRGLVLLVLVVACVPAFVGFLVLTRAAVVRFLFPGTREVARSIPPSFRVLTTTARDGVVVHALELLGPPGARTIVHFHNSRDTAADAAELGESLHALGFGVLLVEYRGYGLSRGTVPSEEGLYDDAEAALDLLSARGVPEADVVLWGTSLGTGVAAEMARRGRGGALVLVTPYTSIPDVITAAAPLVPAHALVAHRFETLRKSAEIRIPTLVIHGDADEVVPFWMGDVLARSIARARLLRVSGGHHGDLFLRERDRLLAAIRALPSEG
jgi:pimeloyl-ACP methyl ester carboxylesterase